MAKNQQLQFYRGAESGLPALQQGEPAWTTDSKRLFIGTDGTTQGNRPVGAPNPGLYGDGSDGDVTLGSNTTLTRDMYYNTLHLNGYDLDTDGFKVYVVDKLTVPSGSRLHNDGADGVDGASGGTGGAAGTTGSLRAGAAGGATAVAGSNLTDALGGDGGAGGAGAAAAGAAGTTTVPAANAGGFRHRNAAQFGAVLGAGAGGWTFVGGGAGGGGGGKSGVNNGGGGGAGGGFVLVLAEEIEVASGGYISANGGSGGDGTAGFNTGGGGGGGGGVVVLIATKQNGGGDIEANGGTGGTGQSGGSNGVDGVDGLVCDFTAA
jgi:hypothetical protein